MKVIVDIPNTRVDRPFDYAVPENLRHRVSAGSRVVVPFGPRKVMGYVLEGLDQPEVKDVREIIGCADALPPLPQDLLEIAKWMSEHYMCLLIEALAVMIPSGSQKSVLAVRLADRVWDDIDAVISGLKNKPAQLGVVTYLLERDPPVTYAEIIRDCECSRGVITSLIQSGLLEKDEVLVERDPFRGSDYASAPRPDLTHEQSAAVSRLCSMMDQGGGVGLVHGITSSGKTEVYLRVLEHARDQGRQGIMLVPDISLTPQMVDRVKSRFGRRVAILHSALGQGERLDEWMRIRKGDVDVVVGARSAVFAPLDRIGAIIIDEEHDTSYKQDESPRYHAREVAVKRAEQSGAIVVLGSATPCLETYYKSEKGEYARLELRTRIDSRPLPEIVVVDMREEMKSKNRSVFSLRLASEIQATLDRGQQVLLFLNRRGYSTFVICRECGHALRCPHCDVSLVYHEHESRMSCHYCNYGERVPDFCPICRGTKIRFFGSGTERIEQEVRRAFPGAGVLRMDVDTTRRKGSHRRIITAFREGKADILVGTQMIAKGLDIPSVSMVGVVSADTALNLPDFRAAERTFQLISQVAGRAGRGHAPGIVVVQTYNPDHYSIDAARDHDYRRFYEREIVSRQATGYPPANELIRIVISSESEQSAHAIATALDRGLGERAGFEVVGPSAAPIPRIAGKYRWHILLKGKDRARLAAAARAAISSVSCSRREARVTIGVNCDPQSIL